MANTQAQLSKMVVKPRAVAVIREGAVWTVAYSWYDGTVHEGDWFRLWNARCKVREFKTLEQACKVAAELVDERLPVQVLREGFPECSARKAG